METALNYLDEEDFVSVEDRMIARHRKEGKKEGIKQGYVKGKQAAVLDIAHKLRDSGLSTAEISAVTELSAAEIEAVNVSVAE